MLLTSELQYIGTQISGSPVCCYGNPLHYTFWVPAGIIPNGTPALFVPSQSCCVRECVYVCVGLSVAVCCIDSGLPVIVSAQKRSVLSLSLPVLQVIRPFTLLVVVCVCVCMYAVTFDYML